MDSGHREHRVGRIRSNVQHGNPVVEGLADEQVQPGGPVQNHTLAWRNWTIVVAFVICPANQRAYSSRTNKAIKALSRMFLHDAAVGLHHEKDCSLGAVRRSTEKRGSNAAGVQPAGNYL